MRRRRQEERPLTEFMEEGDETDPGEDRVDDGCDWEFGEGWRCP